MGKIINHIRRVECSAVICRIELVGMSIPFNGLYSPLLHRQEVPLIHTLPCFQMTMLWNVKFDLSEAKCCKRQRQKKSQWLGHFLSVITCPTFFRILFTNFRPFSRKLFARPSIRCWIRPRNEFSFEIGGTLLVSPLPERWAQDVCPSFDHQTRNTTTTEAFLLSGSDSSLSLGNSCPRSRKSEALLSWHIGLRVWTKVELF